MARLRSRFPGRPRTISSSRERNPVFPPDMDVDMVIVYILSFNYHYYLYHLHVKFVHCVTKNPQPYKSVITELILRTYMQNMKN